MPDFTNWLTLSDHFWYSVQISPIYPSGRIVVYGEILSIISIFDVVNSILDNFFALTPTRISLIFLDLILNLWTGKESISSLER